jgi:hypothetical protein
MENLTALVQAYLAAFDERNLHACLEFYAENATLTFFNSSYQGKQAIASWHQDRFAADLRLLSLDSIQVDSHSVIIEATVTSKRLRAWMQPTINGSAVFAFANGKIAELQFGTEA